MNEVVQRGGAVVGPVHDAVAVSGRAAGDGAQVLVAGQETARRSAAGGVRMARRRPRGWESASRTIDTMVASQASRRAVDADIGVPSVCLAAPNRTRQPPRSQPAVEDAPDATAVPRLSTSRTAHNSTDPSLAFAQLVQQHLDLPEQANSVLARIGGDRHDPTRRTRSDKTLTQPRSHCHRIVIARSPHCHRPTNPWETTSSSS
jgi:hypothetical protein